MPDVHAKLSASGAKKWLNCPGSKALEEMFPDETSEFAEEGTLAHSVGEAKIKYAIKKLNRSKYAHIMQNLRENKYFNEEMEEYTDSYRDFVIEIYNSYKKEGFVEINIEQRLDFSQYVPEGFGTGDVVILGNSCIHIIDLKYGKGVKVDADNNPQLKLYALGALSLYDPIYDIEKVYMTIYQPRLDNISTREISVNEIAEWGNNYVKPRAKEAFNGLGPCVAGIHCDEGFCKARPVCRAYNEQKIAISEKYEFKQPKILSKDEISEILDIADSISKWVTLVKNYALDQALKGEKIPGYKVVEGRSNRQWAVSEDEVIDTYIEKTAEARESESSYFMHLNKIAPRKLKSISELESTLGKFIFNEKFEGLIIKPQGKPTLVNFEDKRPELNTAETAIEDFKDYIKEDK